MFSLFAILNGMELPRKCSHPHLNPCRKTMHTLERHKDQLNVAGIHSLTKLNWNFLKSDIRKIKLNNKCFLLVIGGSPHRPQKRWSIENFINLIKYLNKRENLPCSNWWSE